MMHRKTHTRRLPKKQFRKPHNQMKRIMNLEKNVKKIERETEVKFALTGNMVFGTDDPINQGGVAYLLNGLGLGTLPVQRIGARVFFTSVNIRGHLHPAFTGTPTEVRMILVWDKQANHGNIPLFASLDADGLLDDSILPNAPVHAPFNQTALTRFRVLLDKVWILTNEGNTDATTTNAIAFNIHKKLGRITQYAYDSDTGGVGDITTNALWLFFVGNLNSNLPRVLFNSKIMFKDS